MYRFWLDIWAVAFFELQQSLRNRRALVLLVLYIAGAIGGAMLFTHVVRQIETEVSKALSVSETKTPGAMMQQLVQNQKFKNILTGLVQDKKLAEQLLSVPLIALFYGWLSFTFVPILIILTVSEVVTQDVRSGAVRFTLLRIGRIEFSLGKLLGQMIQLFGVILLSALFMWGIGWFRLAQFEPIRTMQSIGVFAIKVWIYGLSFLGLAIGCSLIAKSENGARVLGIITLIATFILYGLSSYYTRYKGSQIWSVIAFFLPPDHRLSLWRPELESVFSASVICIGLMFTYFTIGFLVFQRRDV